MKLDRLDRAILEQLQKNARLSNQELSHKKDGILRCAFQIGIPMFFYASGISSSFFDSEKNGPVKFIQ